MPGKRKRDEDSDQEDTKAQDVQTHSSTIFISNLPYTATSTDLKTLFSDVAPIKNAFVVLEKETKVSKGVGYVTFAMREDAAECVEKGSVEMNGRNLRVTWADAKPKPGDTAPVKHAKLPRRVNAIPSPQKHDNNAVRTVTLSGFPLDIDSKVIWKKVRKQNGAESVEYPAKNQDGSEDKSKAYVLFQSPSDALHAIERLNAHIFKGSVLGATLKKRLEKQPNRSSRLIVRNLPWDTTESELRKLFLPHGAVYSVEIPTESDDKHDTPRAKGFAFVWMLTKSDAEGVISKVNGTSIKDRTIAVDWALSKEKWLDVKEKIEEEANVDGSEDDDEELKDEDSDDDEALGVHSNEDVSMQSQDEEEEEEEPIKPELPPPEAGTTLFIRNVPWEATEDELRQLFRSFGPLRYVRIVMDQESNRSKGTAFACYWKKEDADKVIVISEALSKETGLATGTKNPFSAPSILAPDPSSSLARNLVIHGRTLDVVRAVTRDTADKLRDAGIKMREKADKRNLYLMREGVIFPNSPAASLLPTAEVEKRINSYNQRRTIIRSNPSLYVSKTRLSIRQLPTFVSERILKRLALHSIREFDNEVKENKRDALNEDEMEDNGQRGVMDSLTGEEVQLPSRPEGENKTKAEKRKSSKSSGRVKQAKIVRLTDKIDSLTGKGRSKGYGFLELERHSDALKVLRWANNNPDVGAVLKEWWRDELKDMFSILEKKTNKSEEETARWKRLKDALNGNAEEKSKRTLIVEFSIENVLVVKKREGRDAQGAQSKPRSGAGDVLDHKKGRSLSRPSTDKERPSARHGTRKSKDDNESPRPLKKAKNADDQDVTVPLKDRIGQRAQPTNPLGSMIGRKRRLRKSQS